jgi:hypothetical protein
MDDSAVAEVIAIRGGTFEKIVRYRRDDSGIWNDLDLAVP